jgi:two-component system, NtrC family, nitrogen regulation response regulator NtrX
LLVTHRARTSAFELPEQGQLVIGRSQSCDVFLDDQQVSRRHAVLHVQPTSIQLEDLGSHNGTLLLGATETLSAMRARSDETQTGASNELRLAPNVLTPISDDALIQIGTALLTLQVTTARRRLQSEAGIPGFVVVDAAMQRVLDLADRAAPTNLTVLLLGESGSGKEMLARYVHQRSPRAAKRMVSLNCGALPENLLESELFGHEKGAFTGATSSRRGKFELAHGGTILLDEVRDLHESSQAKLLRVLQEGEFQRVGGEETRHVRVRVISATNQDLAALVAEKKFREDLYYRLSVVPIRVPPLRERAGDIRPLAEYFVDEFCRRNNFRPKRFDAAVFEELHAYRWPGNIRELRNVVERMAILSPDPITADAIPVEIRLARQAGAPTTLEETRAQAERDMIRQALDRAGWNVAAAARALGVERTRLHKRIRALGLER